jgi:hypothetical protein
MVITEGAAPQTANADMSLLSPPDPNKALAKELVARWRELKTIRTPWEYYWQEVNDLVRPNTQAFQQSFTQGAPRTRKVYDGTAMLDACESAAGIQGLLCNPAERWFNTMTWDKQLIEDDDALMWLEIVSDLMYMHMSLPMAAFNPSMSETLTDEISYGTGCLYSEWVDALGQMRFRTFPLASIYIAEDPYDRVDTVFRTFSYTARQAFKVWGDKTPVLIKKMASEKPESKFNFLHCVFPREERNPRLPNNLNMKYASFWVWLGTGPDTSGSVNSYILEQGDPVNINEGGYSTFPYQVPRFQKIAGETYGRSPAQTVMPDIKTLQTMARTILVAAEKIIDPPILIPDDGFVSPFKTVPGSIIKYEASLGGDIRNLVVPLETRGNIGIGTDLMDKYTDRIDRAFFIDLFRATRKKERQSVPEVQDDRSQQMNLLAPILGRHEPELMGPLLHRVFDCVRQAGILPRAPAILRGKALRFEFTSQAARAQTFGKASVIPQLIQALTPLAQINQGVMDVLDTDEAARQLADALDVTRKVIRSKRDIATIRQQRKQQQDQTNAATNGAQMAAAAKDLASAKQIAQSPAGGPAVA